VLGGDFADMRHGLLDWPPDQKAKPGSPSARPTKHSTLTIHGLDQYGNTVTEIVDVPARSWLACVWRWIKLRLGYGGFKRVSGFRLVEPRKVSR